MDFDYTTLLPASNVSRYEDVPVLGSELGERSKTFVLRHLPVQGDSGQTQTAHHERCAQRVCTGRAEDHERVASHLIQ